MECVKFSGREAAVTCVTVCHNEAGIIDQFLEHYRSIGVGNFLVVDDRSTDGTTDILAAQPDVSLFRPTGGAQFKDNLGKWRQDLLDTYCSSAWVTLPDMDEFLYFNSMPASLSALTVELEAEGSEALIAAMVDMYGDAPIKDQIYTGTAPLEEEFPFFDGVSEMPHGLRIVSQPTSFVRRFPTPSVAIKGGVRERIFFAPPRPSRIQKWMMTRWAHPRRPLNPTWLEKKQNALLRALTQAKTPAPPFVLNKFALLKWPRGAKFSRAPHSLDRVVKVSERLAVFLHFKFYKGVQAFNYNVERGQHAGGSVHYRKILEQADALERNPVYSGSRRFEGLHSLDGLLR